MIGVNRRVDFYQVRDEPMVFFFDNLSQVEHVVPNLRRLKTAGVLKIRSF